MAGSSASQAALAINRRSHNARPAIRTRTTIPSRKRRRETSRQEESEASSSSALSDPAANGFDGLPETPVSSSGARHPVIGCRVLGAGVCVPLVARVESTHEMSELRSRSTRFVRPEEPPLFARRGLRILWTDPARPSPAVGVPGPKGMDRAIGRAALGEECLPVAETSRRRRKGNASFSWGR
jgi:hypothetical protein